MLSPIVSNARMIATSAQKTSYVGHKGVALASEYHESDFDWHEHARIARQSLMHQEGELQGVSVVRTSGMESSTANISPRCAANVAEGENWENFYQQHKEARFYKLRRYILKASRESQCLSNKSNPSAPVSNDDPSFLLIPPTNLQEFPQLSAPGPMHVMEIGCGCGSSILPVLASNPLATATVTDVSSTCISQLHAAASAMGIDPATRLISSFACDSTDSGAGARLFEGIGADNLLIMFTLSAVAPIPQLEMLRNAWRALKPGGRLMLRDHGLYDMVQVGWWGLLADDDQY